MARLPYIDADNPPESIRETFDLLPVKLNLFKMIANAETCFEPFLRLGGAILARQDFDARLRELVILHVGKLWDGHYEWNQHVPIAEAAGVTQAQIGALETGNIAAECFNDCEKAVIKFAGEVVEKGKPSDATFAEAAEHLSPREIIEMLLAIGFYSTVAMITESTDLEIDEAAGTAVVDAAT